MNRPELRDERCAVPALRREVILPRPFAALTLCVLGVYSLVMWVAVLVHISCCTPLLAPVVWSR
jgi:hypothetical protein